MSKQSKTVRRSETHSFALPNINKATSRYAKVHSSRMSMEKHKSFIEKLKEEAPDVEYQYTESEKITEEQAKLKKLLRQFNRDTLDILSERIHKINELGVKKQVPTPQTVVAVRSREIENNNSIITFCQRQIAILDNKCENLKYLSVEEFMKRIHELEKQIQQNIVQNKELIRENTLRGLKMTRPDNHVLELRQIQYDKFSLQSRKEKLQQQREAIEKQLRAIRQKQSHADIEIQNLEDKYQKAVRDEEERKQLIKKKESIADKQKMKKQNQHKKTAIDTKNQHFYLKVLKQLQESGRKTKKYEDDIEFADKQIQVFKKEIESLEEKLSQKNSGM